MAIQFEEKDIVGYEIREKEDGALEYNPLYVSSLHMGEVSEDWDITETETIKKGKWIVLIREIAPTDEERVHVIEFEDEEQAGELRLKIKENVDKARAEYARIEKHLTEVMGEPGGNA